MRVQAGDSIMLVEGDKLLIEATHEPKDRMGKILARFFSPRETLVLKCASIKVIDGAPSVRLEVVEASS